MTTSSGADAALASLVKRVGRVRQWLVMLCILKIAAATLLFVTAYVAAYAVVDHYLNFGVRARMAALLLLVVAVAAMLALLVQLLGAHTSASTAARFIERRIKLDQQLLTAIEFFENRADYPYSRALAEHVVLRVDRQSRALDFDATVPRWQAWTSIAGICLGLLAGALFLRSSYGYFSTYLARLARPLSDVAPLPATTLVPVSGDLEIEYGLPAEVACEIRGRIPTYTMLEIVPAVAADAGIDTVAGEAARELEASATFFRQLHPIYSDDVAPRVAALVPLDVGQWLYRFTAEGAPATEWQSIWVSTLPRIESISARITLPGSRHIEPISVEVKELRLDVLKGSLVTLTIEATEALSLARVSLPGLPEASLEVAGEKVFESTFTALAGGRVELAVVGETGIVNDRLPPLLVTVRSNEPPVMTLLSPDGDYLATDVSSVPIEFEIEDDFGLEWARLKIDVPGSEPFVIPADLEPGAQKATVSHILEIADLDLSVGDAIIYSVEAQDIDIGTADGVRNPALSEAWLIEIRPYRIGWFPDRPMDDEQMSEMAPEVAGQLHESLAALLEYTRAILKKTWALAPLDPLESANIAAANAIRDDVLYVSEQLALVRDNPRFSHPPMWVAAINSCISDFGDASAMLAALRPADAVPPETDAYRTLRRLVDDVRRLCPQGDGPPPRRRDRVVLEDIVHLRRYDSAEEAEEALQLAREIDRAAREEDALRDSFENFLAQNPQFDYRQETRDETSWIDPGARAPFGSQPAAGDALGGSEPTSRASVEGALQPPAGGGAGGDSPFSQPPDGRPDVQERLSEAVGDERENQSGGSGELRRLSPAQGAGAMGRTASTPERLRMFESRQAALEARVEVIRIALDSIAAGPQRQASPEAARIAEVAAAAAALLETARDDMQGFRESLVEMQLGGERAPQAAREASQLLQSATDHLFEAERLLAERAGEPLSPDDPRAIAQRLFDLADRFEQGYEAAQEAVLMSALADAMSQLARMDGQEAERMAASAAQMRAQAQGSGQPAQEAQPGEAAQGGQGEGQSQMMSPAQSSQPQSSGQSAGGTGGAGSPSFTTASPRADHYLASTARLLAARFWTLAIEADRQASGIAETDATDAHFRRVENTFFEKAAHYEDRQR